MSAVPSFRMQSFILSPSSGSQSPRKVPRANEHGLAVSLPAGHAEGDLDDAPVEGAVFLSGRGVGGRRRDAREHLAAGTLRKDGTKGCRTSRWHRLAPIFLFPACAILGASVARAAPAEAMVAGLRVRSNHAQKRTRGGVFLAVRRLRAAIGGGWRDQGHLVPRAGFTTLLGILFEQ